MSVVIGYVANGKVYMATDTHRALGNFRYTVTSKTDSNVFHLPHGVLCGYGGTQIVKQELLTHPRWFEGLANEPLTKQYILDNILPPFYRRVKALGEIPDKALKRGEARFEGNVMLAQGDKLFVIDCDFSVIAIPRFCIIGNAAEYSYARMMLPEEIPLEKKLYLAIDDAEAECNSVSKPYWLYTTDSEEKAPLGGK